MTRSAPVLELLDRLRNLAELRGVDFFGIADLTEAREAIEEQGGPVVAAFQRAVSVGITLPHTVVDQLRDHTDHIAAASYRHVAYDVVNTRLDLIASEIGSEIQRAGYRVIPVPASKRTDDQRICGIFSHKMAARLAGLGWIGKSCLLVTPEAGPRVRWVTILTDAPLPAPGQSLEARCGSCTSCVDSCPVHAFSGEPFREQESREARFDARACERYIAGQEQRSGSAVCGLCLFICPYGKDRQNEKEPAEEFR
jgi:epoxyqueuosine reductase